MAKPLDLTTVIRRGVLGKMSGAQEHLIQKNHPKADRFGEYIRQVESAINDGRANDAANYAWEAAHLWNDV